MNSSAPLVLVDNVERSMNNLDPYEIESISVLKDASATAIFGVRGANGVILITTKKGTPGKAKVTANVNYSLQAPTRLPQPLDAVSYMTLRNEVIEQHNNATGQSNPLDFGEEVFQAYENNVLPEYYVDRNFYDEFLHDYVPMLRSNVNISGGSDKVKYFTSIGYLSQGGPFKTEKWDEYNYDNEQRLNRLTYRANIDFQVTKGGCHSIPSPVKVSIRSSIGSRNTHYLAQAVQIRIRNSRYICICGHLQIIERSSSSRRLVSSKNNWIVFIL